MSTVLCTIYMCFVFRLFSRTLFGLKDTTISSLPMGLNLSKMPLTHMSEKSGTQVLMDILLIADRAEKRLRMSLIRAGKPGNI